MPSAHPYLALALRRAQRATGQTADNPAVGCLITSAAGQVVALAHTAPTGRPHGEVAALAQAGARAKGGHAFVTLEPCAHQGRSGPCCEALAQAGIARVTIGARDLNPAVNGQGAAHLEAAGVEVTWADHAGCIAHHAGFNRRMTRGGGRLILKIATSADGAMYRTDIAGRTIITGPEVQRQVHLLRAQSDVIVTGRGTIERDQPRFTVRLPGYGGAQPAIHVLARGQALPAVNQIMIEAGPTLSSALFPQADELHWYRGPEAFGAAGVRPDFMPSDPVDFSMAHPTWTLQDRRRFGRDIREIWTCSQD